MVCPLLGHNNFSFYFMRAPLPTFGLVTPAASTNSYVNSLQQLNRASQWREGFHVIGSLPAPVSALNVIVQRLCVLDQWQQSTTAAPRFKVLWAYMTTGLQMGLVLCSRDSSEYAILDCLLRRNSLRSQGHQSALAISPTAVPTAQSCQLSCSTKTRRFDSAKNAKCQHTVGKTREAIFHRNTRIASESGEMKRFLAC